MTLNAKEKKLFKIMLMEQDLTSKTFCERNNINYASFRQALCGKQVMTEKAEEAVRNELWKAGKVKNKAQEPLTYSQAFTSEDFPNGMVLIMVRKGEGAGEGELPENVKLCVEKAATEVMNALMGCRGKKRKAM